MPSSRAILLLTVLLLAVSCHLVVGADDYVLGPAVGGSGGQATGSGGAGAVGGSGAAGGGAAWLDGYSFRKAIRCGAAPGDLSGFVVGILLDDDAQLAQRAQDDGDDLVFTGADGTSRLPHEIEVFNGETGELVAWVRVPLLSSTTATTIYLYYGNGAATEDQAVHETWAGTFAGVWHLSESLALAPSSFYRDSTANENHGAVEPPALPPAEQTGIAGRAAFFDGQASPIFVGDPANESLDFGTSSFSYSVWVYVESSAGSYDMPWYKGGASAGNVGYDFELGTNGWIAGLSDAIEQPIAAVQLGNETENRNGWTQLVAVVDRSSATFRGYVNGALRDEAAIGHFESVSTVQEARISPSHHPMLGGVDEMRVYTTALRPEWIAAQYANLSSPSTFYELGDEQAAPLDG